MTRPERFQQPKIESDLRLLKWMVGFNIAMTAGLVLKAIV
jgi:hypothetical protein